MTSCCAIYHDTLHTFFAKGWSNPGFPVFEKGRDKKSKSANDFIFYLRSKFLIGSAKEKITTLHGHIFSMKLGKLCAIFFCGENFTRIDFIRI